MDKDQPATPVVVLYDGDCPMCTASAGAWVRRYGEQIEAVNLRTADIAGIDVRLQLADCEREIHVLADGTIYTGAGAVARVLRLHPLLRWLTPLYRLPFIRPVADWAYGVVARHRLQLSHRHRGRS